MEDTHPDNAHLNEDEFTSLGDSSSSVSNDPRVISSAPGGLSGTNLASGKSVSTGSVSAPKGEAPTTPSPSSSAKSAVDEVPKKGKLRAGFTPRRFSHEQAADASDRGLSAIGGPVNYFRYVWELISQKRSIDDKELSVGDNIERAIEVGVPAAAAAGSFSTGPIKRNLDEALDTGRATNKVDDAAAKRGSGFADAPTPRVDGVPSNTVIGRLDDIKPEKLRPGEKNLLDRLPNQGDYKLNWKQNSSVLRDEIRKGKPIRDASAHLSDDHVLNSGKKVRNTFLGMERNTLRNKGWTFDGEFWNPPAQ